MYDYLLVSISLLLKYFPYKMLIRKSEQNTKKERLTVGIGNFHRHENKLKSFKFRKLQT